MRYLVDPVCPRPFVHVVAHRRFERFRGRASFDVSSSTKTRSDAMASDTERLLRCARQLSHKGMGFSSVLQRRMRRRGLLARSTSKRGNVAMPAPS
jgi:hypothetical protein